MFSASPRIALAATCLASASVLAGGCAESGATDSGTAGTDEVTASDIKEQAQEALGTAAEYGAQQKEAFMTTMQTRFDKLEAKVDELKAKADAQMDKAGAEATKAMAELDAKVADARARLAEARSDSSQAIDELKAGLTQAIDELETAVSNAAEHFKS